MSALIFLKFLILFSALFHHYTLGDIAILTPENRSVELFIDYKITYTPPIPDDGIFGILTTASPMDACSPINAPPKIYTNTSINWFVLAYRSSSFHARCSNREKIQNAANAGYKVIILYSPNSFYQTSVNYSPFEHSNVSIPAVLVSHEDGVSLRNNFLYQSGYKLFITTEIPPNFSYYLIPFAIVIGAGILIIISYLIFQLMMCIMERRKAQRYRLSKKYLKKLTLQKYEKGIFYETCAICLDDYLEGEKIRILPCNHAYHMKCIDPWLTKNRRVCPVCKAKVTLPGMKEYSDSDSDTEHRRLVSSETSVTETTRLIPSGSSSRTNSRNRELWNFFDQRLLVLIDNRNNSTATNIPRNSRLNQNPTSSSRLNMLDNTIQPGPSTSAPIISELNSNRDQSRRTKKKKRRRSNVQVVVADVSPLMAPPQLSINCDSESERPITPVNNNNNDKNNSDNPGSHNGQQQSSRSSQISMDQIV